MFMFPEPPPLDYCLTDIKPGFLSDGVFYLEKPTATHKFVAKQLTPIKRKASDPLAPVRELDSRTLKRILEREKESYVACVGKDDGVVFQTLGKMPKWKPEYQGTQKSSHSIFPRSQQFELCQIRERRLKDFAKRGVTVVECTKNEETAVSDDAPCGLLKPPVWWKAEPGEPSKLPLGNINDYAYEKLKDFDRDIKLSERLEMDHPKRYIPGAIHRLTNPKDTSMQDALERADTFKVVSQMDEITLNGPPVDECVLSTKKQPAFTCCNLKARADEDPDTAIYDNDKRWRHPEENLNVPKSDLQREDELRYLTKPFLHDLHTWYTKNKPTKLIIPVRHIGKKPILERRYSHL